MPAYFIAHRREITDPETLKAYAGVESTLRPYGGKVIVRSDSSRCSRATGTRASARGSTTNPSGSP